jgi:hypothetical protein
VLKLIIFELKHYNFPEKDPVFTLINRIMDFTFAQQSFVNFLGLMRMGQMNGAAALNDL